MGELMVTTDVGGCTSKRFLELVLRVTLIFTGVKGHMITL